MRTLILAFLATLCYAAAQAQTAPLAAQVQCSLQPGPAASPALTAFTAGDFPGAETLYAAQTSASPAAAYPGLVRAQLQANDLPAALASANAAIAAQPASALAQSLLGDVLYRSGQIPESFAAYKAALGKDRCAARAHFGLGRLYQLTGRHGAAAHEFDLARRLSPGDAEILAAYLQSLPEEVRAAPLRAFLAGHPALPPQQLAALTTGSAILNAHALCTAVNEQPTAQLALVPIFTTATIVRSWGLKPKINGAELPLVELDSSVDGIVLNPADAAKAALTPLPGAPAPVEGQPYTAIARKLLIGQTEYLDCPVRVVPANYLAGSNSVIGTSFFRDRLIHIDYAAEILTLHPLPPRTPAAAATDVFVPPDETSWSQVYIAGPEVLVPTLINKQGPFLFALDTGIRRTVTSPAVTASLLTAVPDDSEQLHGTDGAIVKVIAKTGGGESDLNRTDIYTPRGALLHVKSPRKLPVYRFTLNEVPDPDTISFDLAPMSHSIGVEVSGLLSFNILRAYITDINYRDALIRIQFDQNRRYLVRESEGHY